MAMHTVDEGEGFQQMGKNLTPHRPDQSCLFQELFDAQRDISMGQGSTKPDLNTRLFGDSNANSILQSPDGTDFQVFDGTLNASGGDVTSSLFPKVDSVGAGPNVFESIGKSISDIAGAGMPLGLLGQLFQFLLHLFTEGINDVGNQLAQSAAAAASEATKKLKI